MYIVRHCRGLGLVHLPHVLERLQISIIEMPPDTAPDEFTYCIFSGLQKRTIQEISSCYHTHTHTHTSLPSPLARRRLIPQGTHPVCPQQDRKTGLNLLSRPVPRHPHHPPGKRANKKTVPHLVQVPSTKLMNGKKLTARSFLSSSRLLCLSVARTPRIPFFCGFAFGIFAVF